MKLIRFHPDAGMEVVEAVQYYEECMLGLGLDLLGEVERSLDQILANPDMSQRIGRISRRKSLWRFPYNLIYAVYPDRIRVVAFAHQKRRPFYWRKRLRDVAEGKDTTTP